eukprot:923174-Lingulodinium_polyedra.AAC.1
MPALCCLDPIGQARITGIGSRGVAKHGQGQVPQLVGCALPSVVLGNPSPQQVQSSSWVCSCGKILGLKAQGPKYIPQNMVGHSEVKDMQHICH